MTEPPAPAVLAEDLRALAEVVPFDAATTAVLEHAADALGQHDAPTARPEAPTVEAITEAVETVLDAALIQVTATQDGQPYPLWRLVRLLDRNGLIDWTGVR